jgi:cysteine desulfurase/selenocysteine lyase
VQDIGADFFVFSGHKVYGPTGIGILHGRRALLEYLPPWKGGGEMIKKVSFDGTTYNDLPFKYEAGTPNIEGGIALAAALEWINTIDLDAIHLHETALIRQAADALGNIAGLRLYGPDNRAAALSFNIDGVHHYDLGTLLDQMGIAVRTGHHCCQPLMDRFGTTGTIRASFAAYNTPGEVDQLASAIAQAATMLR